jgi:uracil-DNA glycosylase
MATRVAYPGAERFLPDQRDLDTLRTAAARCEGCDLYRPATQTVFGAGNEGSSLLLVGEQPGDVEDVEGVPFVGPAGRVLAEAIKDAGLADVPTYVTNAVKHFSFTRVGRRRLHQTPKVSELIVCLGATAVKSVLGNDVKVLRDRGTVLERDSLVGSGAFLVTVHPSAILRAPDETRAVQRGAFVADLRVAAEYLAR